ncbi:unnamed protein product [Schistosoma haematobium]|nr:unnamed protein product [Schistosoma haematobium]
MKLLRTRNNFCLLENEKPFLTNEPKLKLLKVNTETDIENCTSGVKQSGLRTFELYFRPVIKVQTTYSSGI